MRVKRIRGELDNSVTDATLGGSIETVQDFFGFVSDADGVSSQAAFAFVFFQRLHAAGGDIGDGAIKSCESTGVQGCSIFVCSVTKILQPNPGKFSLIVR